MISLGRGQKSQTKGKISLEVKRKQMEIGCDGGNLNAVAQLKTKS